MNLIRRYGLFLYWLVFAAYAMGKASEWGDVFVVWIALGLAVFQLRRIIDPKNYSALDPRFGRAFGFSLLLVLIFFGMFHAPRMPPVMDVPIYFALVTTVVMFICAAAETIVFEFRRRNHQPGGPE